MIMMGVMMTTTTTIQKNFITLRLPFPKPERRRPELQSRTIIPIDL
jgi:hypothetical protein